MSHPVYINNFLRYYRNRRDCGYFFGGHTHPAWEVNVVTSGAMEITYDNTISIVRKNMLMLIESDVFHRNRVLSPEGADMYVYQFVSDNMPRGKAGVYELSDNNFALIKLIEEEAEKNITEKIERSVKVEKFSYQAEKLLEVLLTRLVSDENTVGYETNPDEEIYGKAVTYMKENIARNLCIDEIARECCVSNTRLKNVFNRYTGNGVIAHFSNMKINEAKKLLDKGMPVGEVSEQLGYSSQGYMSLCFKRATGISPLKYKKEKGM